MSIKTIKGIDRSTWLKFKEIAVKRGVTMGSLFSDMVDEYEKDSSDFWSEILSGKRRISDKEANDMHKTVKELRKEKGFRV